MKDMKLSKVIPRKKQNEANETWNKASFILGIVTREETLNAPHFVLKAGKWAMEMES